MILRQPCQTSRAKGLVPWKVSLELKPGLRVKRNFTHVDVALSKGSPSSRLSCGGDTITSGPPNFTAFCILSCIVCNSQSNHYECKSHLTHCSFIFASQPTLQKTADGNMTENIFPMLYCLLFKVRFMPLFSTVILGHQPRQGYLQPEVINFEIHTGSSVSTLARLHLYGKLPFKSRVVLIRVLLCMTLYEIQLLMSGEVSVS